MSDGGTLQHLWTVWWRLAGRAACAEVRVINDSGLLSLSMHTAFVAYIRCSMFGSIGRRQWHSCRCGQFNQLCRLQGSVGGEVLSLICYPRWLMLVCAFIIIFNISLQEYGNGRLHKKHSTFFAKMLEEVGLSSTPEHYFDLLPWQVLYFPSLHDPSRSS